MYKYLSPGPSREFSALSRKVLGFGKMAQIPVEAYVIHMCWAKREMVSLQLNEVRSFRVDFSNKITLSRSNVRPSNERHTSSVINGQQIVPISANPGQLYCRQYCLKTWYVSQYEFKTNKDVENQYVIQIHDEDDATTMYEDFKL